MVRVRSSASARPNSTRSDARLSYGEVKQAMLAVEAAGFKNVGLVTERQETAD